MPEFTWQPIRLALLAATLGGTLLAWGKILATPKPDSTRAEQKQNILAPTVALAGWQLLDSQESKLTSDKAPTESESQFGRRYRYQKGNTPLQVDLQYMTSDGNVSRYLFVYSPVRTANANLKVKYQPGVGHYGVVSHKGQIYLSACINPRGTSTVTEQQFTQNRYAYDLQVGRLLPWILGQESLIDRRCLWTLMSTPLKTASNSGTTASEEAAYKDLESAWFSWYQWWQANYPSP